LVVGSSAVDAAPCTGAVTTDQRSYGRPGGLAPTTTTIQLAASTSTIAPGGMAGSVADSGTLPVTGADPMSLLLLAGGFLALGVVLLATSRRGAPTSSA
jgi:LPXTG-motif cell wall-anchored protein